uniref:PKD domain-containing protein n=1 Tax=Aeromonas sp. Ne-1 TaxID=1675689 RepID=UPI00191EBAF0
MLSKKSGWKIRLTVTDTDGANNTKTEPITVGNRPPKADFSFSPSTIYIDTTVTFTDKSSDPDGDTLTYKWEYQEPNSTTWTQFSTEKNPTKVLNKKK